MPKSPKNKNVIYKNDFEDTGSSSSEAENENIEFLIESEEEDTSVMDEKEFKNYLKRIFPNMKNLDEKMKEMDEIDKAIDKENNDKKSKKNKKMKSKKKSSSKDTSKGKSSQKTDSSEKETSKKKKQIVPRKSKKDLEYSSSSGEESDSEFEIDEEEYIDEEEIEALLKDGALQMNVVFTVPGMGMEMEDLDEYYCEKCEESECECETTDEEQEEETESEDEEVIVKSSKKRRSARLEEKKGKSKKKIETPKNVKNSKNKKSVKEESESEEERVERSKKRSSKTLDEDGEYKAILDELSKHVKGKNEKGKMAVYKKLEQMAIEKEKVEQEKEKKKQKKTQKKNTYRFRNLVKDKNANTNDFHYFEKLDIEKQNQIIEEMEKINKITKVDKPYRIKLLESTIPPEYKQFAMKKINNLKYMEPSSGEYYKVKQWVDGFMNIPFGTYSKIPMSLKENTKEEVHEFMEKSRNMLNDVVYGLNDAKLQIMQIVGQWISNPSAVGNAIAIKGPMGTGKTTLVKEGVSKILNRPFAFIPLGGATDSSYLEGHSYTYEGSMWGKIVDILVNSSSMNPVFYFDELDKVSDTPKGEEIIGILTHLTDTTQNSQYHDKYFSNIDFDLSKALFIFSYNDETKINPILKDRMYHIETKGYDNKDKNIIANKYLLPKIRENVCFDEGEIIIPDETLEYINTNLTNGEKGVRNLKRCLETIYTKLNLFRLMKSDTNLFDKDISLKVEFPFTVTSEVIDTLIKKRGGDGEAPPYGMYV